MRHLGSLIVALVVGSVAWVLLAFGLDRSGEAFAADRGGALQAHDFLKPLLLLAVAGLLLGIIGTLRLSRLGPLVLGIAYTFSYTLLLVAPERLMDLFTANLSVAGRHADLSTPIRTGTSLLVGILLLLGSIRAGRRRMRGPVTEPATVEAPALQPSYTYAEPEPARYTDW